MGLGLQPKGSSHFHNCVFQRPVCTHMGTVSEHANFFAEQDGPRERSSRPCCNCTEMVIGSILWAESAAAP